jgi:hypothetical protein
MPKPNDYSPLPAPTPVTPPTLPPDFPDIPQNPSSEMQPAPPPSATPDEVEGTTLDPAEPEVQRGFVTPVGRRSTPL